MCRSNEGDGIASTARALLWYQGESDNGNEALHAQNFDLLYNDWHGDFAALEQLYVFQVRTGCGVSRDAGACPHPPRPAQDVKEYWLVNDRLTGLEPALLQVRAARADARKCAAVRRETEELTAALSHDLLQGEQRVAALQQLCLQPRRRRRALARRRGARPPHRR